MRASLAIKLACVASALLGAACSSVKSKRDAGTGDLDGGLSDLPTVALPLSCVEPVTAQGSCARNADCESPERCVVDVDGTHADRSPLPLTCGAPIGNGKAREPCREPEDCVSGICGLADVCMTPCASTADCLKGQVCMPVEARYETGLEPVNACARVFAFSDDVTLAKVPKVTLPADMLSPVLTGATAGDALVFLKGDCGSSAEVRSLRAAGSQSLLFDLNALLTGKGTRNPVVNGGAFIPLLVPNNPTLSASASGYEIGVVFDRETSVDVVTATRKGEHSILDFNLFLVGAGQEADPSGLHPGSPEVRDLMERMDKRLQKIGMQVGKVREHDVVGALRDELSVIETRQVTDENGNLVDLEIEGIDELFELSAGLDDPGVNLFLVSDMGDLLGISGGIPGAVGAHGTSMSGVAVAVDTVGLDGIDAVIQHEVSHQLGLFHTSEIDGFVIEPLTDTPACTVDRDNDGNYVLTPDECRNAGAENLMFWAGSGSQVSAQQAEILRRSPALR